MFRVNLEPISTILMITNRIKLASEEYRWSTEQATGWMIQGSIPGRSKRSFTSPKHPDQLWGLQSLLFILPSLRMSGAVPILPLCAFMLCRGTALFLPLKAKLSLLTPWRHLWGAEVQLHSFLTLAIHWGEWLTSNPSQYSPKKEKILFRLLGYKHECRSLVQSLKGKR